MAVNNSYYGMKRFMKPYYSKYNSHTHTHTHAHAHTHRHIDGHG